MTVILESPELSYEQLIQIDEAKAANLGLLARLPITEATAADFAAQTGGKALGEVPLPAAPGIDGAADAEHIDLASVPRRRQPKYSLADILNQLADQMAS